MSGVKCGEIRLEDVIQSALSATFAASAAATSARASAAALEAEVQSLLDAAQRLLTTGAKEAHRDSLESFLATMANVRTAVAQLNTIQLAIEAARRDEPAIERGTLDELARLRDACNTQTSRVRSLIAGARNQVGTVAAAVRDEERGQQYAASLISQLLMGLVADIDRRLESTLPGGLRAVKAEVLRLRQEIVADAASDKAETTVEQRRAALDKLIGDASSLEESVLEQRVKHHRLMETFKTAGYRLAPGSEHVPDDYFSAAKSTQLIDQSDVTAQTEVHLGGKLQLIMLGPSGSGAQVINCDETCDPNLQRLIEAAKAHGLKLVNVVPVPEGGAGTEETHTHTHIVKPKEIAGSI